LFGGGGESAVQTGMVRVHRQAVAHSDANAARAWRRRPFRHYIVNRWIGCVDRRHHPKLIRIGVVNFERVARVVFIGAERRDHDRTVDTDTVHRSDHLFACGGVESVRGTGPRPAGMISIKGMNLNVDDWHGRPPACSTNCRGISLYHEPVLAMLVQGSAGGSASPACSSSREMPSGVRMKAMRPSRGGRLIVTPWAMKALQVS